MMFVLVGVARSTKIATESRRLVSTQGNKTFWMIGVLIALFISAIYGLFNKSEESGSTRPEGQAPAGKVWSSAHGHWHDS